MNRVTHILIVLLIGSWLSGCATSPTGRSQLMLVSPQSAIVQSEKAYASTMTQLQNEQQLVTDPKRLRRIETITGRLISKAVEKYPNSQRWQWSVAVIDDPDTINAWCMAGGRMAIYTGIIDQLALNDDEIAQIMGHEIAHALANHSAERMSRAMVMQAGLIAAGAATEQDQLTLAGAALAAKLALELPNSRTAETEADRIGIELATLAGYRPEAAVSLWQKMAKVGGGGTPEFLSTHPSPGNRAKTLGRLAERMRALNPNQTKAPMHPVKMVTSGNI
ncbi:peptidase M48 Ste24p [Bacterioplanes sanyensis]|uniref:Peptidase M48 Ste24p n=1 Tax=Bacterioplanes sanyensis TaxID=1249553 RepID=A0A222FKH3_9GAMM|nr:M48 family metallopeptidase [Bacterioplanes sanyensis]ASP39249.1 peptidase M48 Ste24p [Bacterioplanes sanyensis]